MLICSLITVLDRIHPREIISRPPPAASVILHGVVWSNALCWLPADLGQACSSRRHHTVKSIPVDQRPGHISTANDPAPYCCGQLCSTQYTNLRHNRHPGAAVRLLKHLQSVSKFNMLPDEVTAAHSKFGYLSIRPVFLLFHFTRRQENNPRHSKHALSTSAMAQT